MSTVAAHHKTPDVVLYITCCAPSPRPQRQSPSSCPQRPSSEPRPAVRLFSVLTTPLSPTRKVESGKRTFIVVHHWCRAHSQAHKLTSSQASQQGRPEQAAGLASPGLGVAAAQCSSLSQTADLFHQRLLSCRSYQRPATSDHPHHRYTAAAATAVARRDRSLCNKTSFDDS